MVFFDIDRFQDVNRTLGFREGDQVLAKVAELLAQNFSIEQICHYDSDHFAVFYQGTNPERQIRTVQESIAHYLPHFYLFLRAGIYVHRANQTFPKLNVVADYAKYASDTLRRQYAISLRYYDDALDQQRLQEAFVLGHFDEALASGNILPYFQPIVDTATGSCVGYEALARWKDPELGMISPAVFVPVLEHSYDTFRLDSYMLEEVCKRIARQTPEAQERLFVSFNVSRSDFDTTDVPSAIEKIVAKYQVPKGCIRVEVTESMIEDSARIRHTVKEIRKIGYKVWLDDFGSGASSLNVLKDYEFDGAKLDGKFLEGFEDSEKAHTIIRSLLDLCHSLDMKTVVEGVETEAQADFVKQNGGDRIQGFYYSKPLSDEELLTSPLGNLLRR